MSNQRGIDWAEYEKNKLPIPQNKHTHEYLDKHPEGRYLTEAELTHCLLALLEAGGNVYKAWEVLKEYGAEAEREEQDIEGIIYIPPDRKTARYCLANVKGKHAKEIRELMVTNETMWIIRDLYLSSPNERVKLDAAKYTEDRVLGKPMQTVLQEVNILTWEQIREKAEADRAKYQHGEWVNPIDEGGVSEDSGDDTGNSGSGPDT